MESSPDQKSLFESYTVVIRSINSSPLITDFFPSLIYTILFSCPKQNKVKYIFAITILLSSMDILINLYPLPQKSVLFAESVYLAGLSNQMGVLPIFVLCVDNILGNILHRELEACGFGCAPCSCLCFI